MINAREIAILSGHMNKITDIDKAINSLGKTLADDTSKLMGVGDKVKHLIGERHFRETTEVIGQTVYVAMINMMLEVREQLVVVASTFHDDLDIPEPPCVRQTTPTTE